MKSAYPDLAVTILLSYSQAIELLQSLEQMPDPIDVRLSAIVRDAIKTAEAEEEETRRERFRYSR